MKVARTRIGRITMKNSAAVVRVIHRDPVQRITQSIQNWVADLRRYEDPPTAFAAIAFWGSDEAHRKPHLIGWDTIDGALPLPRLMRVAAAQIEAEGNIQMAEHRIMKHLGYVPDEA